MIEQENAKKLLPIIQAIAEGKKIQYSFNGATWFDKDENLDLVTVCEDIISDSTDYRIKPEENYTIEQNCGENRIEGGVLSVSGSVSNELNKHCKWCKGKGCNCATCHNKDEENSYYLLHKDKFPEPKEKKYRPFKDCSELVNHCGTKLIWIRDKTEDAKGDIELITGFTEHGNVLLNGTSYPLQHLFQMYEFLDGTPCGVEE